ncbi:MAG: M28 family peptidase [Planctomycetota bacterium]|nr:M28 family peptidase [Planctomycetota bacterium]
MRSHHVPFVATFLLIAGLGQAAPAGHDDSNELSAAIGAEEIQAHVEWLASDDLQGRLSGTEACDRAAEYVAEKFEDAGLEPAGEKGTFFQTFDILVRTELGEGNRLEAGIGGERHPAKVEEDYIPLASSPAGKAKGPLVFAGFGISSEDPAYDDYDGLDVKGKVLLIFRHEPKEDESPLGGAHGPRFTDRLKATRARDRGAVAVLLVTDPMHHEGEPDPLPRLRGGNQHGDVGIPAVRVRREWIAKILELAGQDLREMQEAIEADMKPHSFAISEVEVEVSVDVRRIRKPTRNVVGRIPGTHPTAREEAIVFGAHYDHVGLGGDNSRAPDSIGVVHNGADDNASGTSGLIELAEAFALGGKAPRRTLLFIAFTGEEEGLLGSAYHVAHPSVAMDKTIAMFNFDMIGRAKNRKVHVIGVGSGKGLKELVEEANGESGLDLAFSMGAFAGSDHLSFVTKKVPVLFFFTGVHEDYHRPSDDADKIQSDVTAEIVQLALKVGWVLDGMEEAPRFVDVPAPVRPTGGQGVGYGAYLGTIPDFAEVEGGVRIAGVSKGSPAEKAGMQGGDILIRLGKRAIRNLYDFTFALRERKPGDEVEVEVLRKDEKLTLKATLGKRN